MTSLEIPEPCCLTHKNTSMYLQYCFKINKDDKIIISFIPAFYSKIEGAPIKPEEKLILSSFYIIWGQKMVPIIQEYYKIKPLIDIKNLQVSLDYTEKYMDCKEMVSFIDNNPFLNIYRNIIINIEKQFTNCLN